MQNANDVFLGIAHDWNTGVGARQHFRDDLFRWPVPVHHDDVAAVGHHLLDL